MDGSIYVHNIIFERSVGFHNSDCAVCTLGNLCQRIIPEPAHSDGAAISKLDVFSASLKVFAIAVKISLCILDFAGIIIGFYVIFGQRKGFGSISCCQKVVQVAVFQIPVNNDFSGIRTVFDVVFVVIRICNKVRNINCRRISAVEKGYGGIDFRGVFQDV